MMKQTTSTITDTFWKKYRQLVKDVMIPYQWSVINDDATVQIASENNNVTSAVEKSHAIQNLRIAAHQADGEFYGWWFQDSDVYKWLEAVAYALRYAPDTQLQATADQVIDLINAAQQPDGYLDTFIQLNAPDRKFKRVSISHELYCMGHYIEAGIAYFQTTQNQLALDIAIRMANCIITNFGPESNKMHGYPGHPEIELALAKLAEQTGDSRYTELAAYMIKQRGTKPNFFAQQALASEGLTGAFTDNDPDDSYLQNHPVLDMQTVEGHAVRMTYLLTGMTHIARQTDDSQLLKASKRLWDNIVQKQMYITGGIGSTVLGEAFTYDYDLPNDTMYAETCASCAMVFLAQQMIEASPDGQYADVMERELFNNVISGMSLDAKHFFYVNPLEVDPIASANDPTKSHVKVQRPSWFGCACCPPNLARLIASLDQYLYTTQDKTIYSNQFIANETTFNDNIIINQQGNYPWSGQISYQLTIKEVQPFIFAIRIPNWSQTNYRCTVNGALQTQPLEHGYLKINQNNKGSVEIKLNLDMAVKRMSANPLVKADLGKVAIQRGPLVYCLEETDNTNHLAWVQLPNDASFLSSQQSLGLPSALTTLKTTGKKLTVKEVNQPLYQPQPLTSTSSSLALTFIPYFAWANRTPGEMIVWVKTT